MFGINSYELLEGTFLIEIKRTGSMVTSTLIVPLSRLAVGILPLFYFFYLQFLNAADDRFGKLKPIQIVDWRLLAFRKRKIVLAGTTLYLLVSCLF